MNAKQAAEKLYNITLLMDSHLNKSRTSVNHFETFFDDKDLAMTPITFQEEEREFPSAICEKIEEQYNSNCVIVCSPSEIEF